MPERTGNGTRWFATVALVASALVAWPFAPWVLLAIWAAVFMRPLHRALARRLGARPRVAAALTIGLLALLLAPVVILVMSLVGDAIDLVDRLVATDRAQDVLRQLVQGDGHTERSFSDLVELVLSQGGRAWTVAREVAGTAARIVIGVVIFVAGTYAMLVDGERWYAWLERHAPTTPETTRRLAAAFVETGRGLLVGIAGAGLAQSIVATIAYVVLGVPQPLALGLLTFCCSVVPVVGTSIVWLPVAAGLAITGRPGDGIGLAIVGVGLIGTVDNLVRPYLARRGRLQLPTFVVLVAMLGGVALLGPRGLLLGPLIVRLTKEVLVTAAPSAP